MPRRHLYITAPAKHFAPWEKSNVLPRSVRVCAILFELRFPIGMDHLAPAEEVLEIVYYNEAYETAQVQYASRSGQDIGLEDADNFLSYSDWGE